MNHALKYIREHYDVPAEIGGAVVYNCPNIGPRRGTITGARGAYLLIRLDGDKHSGAYHPTWALTYV